MSNLCTILLVCVGLNALLSMFAFFSLHAMIKEMREFL